MTACLPEFPIPYVDHSMTWTRIPAISTNTNNNCLTQNLLRNFATISSSILELQAPCTGRISQGFDPAVIFVIPSVEGDFRDPFFFGASGEEFSDTGRCI